jgi:NADH:ubiquinone reductase (H+-translocating)
LSFFKDNNMKVVIVGAGFAGLQLARALNNKNQFEVTLIDKNNFHQFQPLLYQVATAGLDASNISFPLRKIFQKSKNVRIKLAEVTAINEAEKLIETNEGTIAYDKLILATGADTNFFGNATLQAKTFPMKSTTEALELRYQLLQNFENAAKETTDETRTKWLNIVVVGGGATGVEISGAISELRNNVLPKDYPEIDFGLMNIYLLEGSKKVLGSMSEASSADSRRYLEKLKIIVRTETMLDTYDGETVTLKNGETIISKTVIWAAGIKGNIPKGIDEKLIARGNRIMVDRLNNLLTNKDIYAVGDNAFMSTPIYPNAHPQVATVAIDQAKNIAANLIRLTTGNAHNLLPFEYKDKGSMATVGRHLAVVDIPKPKLHLKGLIAWLIWMGLHLVLILGVKNKIQVFVNWMYKYFTYDQSLRLLFNIKQRVVK